MRNIIVTLTFTFILALVGCDNSATLEDSSHLSACNPEQVEELQVTVLYGRGILKIRQVWYENAGIYGSTLSYNVEDGEVVGIPFCFGKGDTTFYFEVVPQGEPQDPSLGKKEVQLQFSLLPCVLQWATMELSWNGNVLDTGSSVGAQSLTYGEAETFAVAIRWPQL